MSLRLLEVLQSGESVEKVWLKTHRACLHTFSAADTVANLPWLCVFLVEHQYAGSAFYCWEGGDAHRLAHHWTAVDEVGGVFREPTCRLDEEVCRCPEPD